MKLAEHHKAEKLLQDKLQRLREAEKIAKTKQREALSTRVLELLVKDTPLSTILETMVLGAEHYSPGTYCSVLLIDQEGKHLLHGAAPSLPDYYNEAIDGVEVGIGIGSCGTAAFTGKRVIVEDVHNHPYWAAFKPLTKKAGLDSCWSEPITDSSGNILGSFAIYNAQPAVPSPKDIELIEFLANLTAIVLERIHASAALKESEEKYRELVEQASDGIFLFDPKGNFLEANARGSLMTGYEKDEIRGLNIKQIIDEKDLATKPLNLKELSKGKHLIFERKIKRKDGSLFDSEISAKMLRDGNAHAIMRDISTRKKAELELKESKRKLDLTLDSTSDLIGLVDFNQKGEFVFSTANRANLAMIKSLGIHPNDYFGTELKTYCTKHLGFSKQEALELEKKYLQVVKEDKPVTTQNSFQNPAGNVFYTQTTINPVFEENGTVNQVLVITRDITEGRKAELALKESEKRLALTLDSTVDMMGLVDMNEKGEFIFNTANRASRESFKHLQVDEKEYFGAELKSYCMAFLGFTKEEALELEKKYQQVVKEKKPIIVSSSSPTSQGGVIHMETTVNPVFEKDGSVKQVLWVNKDVTQAKEVEKQIKNNEQKLNEAQKIAKLGSWEYDFASQQTSWSVEQYRILELEEMPPDKLLKAFQNKVHPDDFPKFEQYDRKAIETGEGFSYEYRIICNDGSIKYLLTVGEPIKDKKGNVIGLKGTDQDITHTIESQKRQLLAMMSGEEKERKRLAAELHDSLGQTLSLISLNLDSILNMELEKPDLTKQKLQASLEMVNQTIEDIRTISRGLSPSALENYGLDAVLKNLLNSVRAASTLNINYSIDKTIRRLEPDIEINIYRIIQEALSNTLKHANATKIKLAIQKKGKTLHISYKDDGKGFNPSSKKKSFNGLLNIENRVFLLGGNINVQSELKQGTTLNIKIPI